MRISKMNKEKSIRGASQNVTGVESTNISFFVSSRHSIFSTEHRQYFVKVAEL
jgi:hypothetical protein